MSLVTNAYISGSLGQAIFIDRGRSMILEVSRRDSPRLSTGNDISLFFNAALEITAVGRDSISIEEVSHRLVEETKQFDALDGLLVGMDPDHDAGVRRKFVARSERLMSSDAVIADFVRRRFLIPARQGDWDVAGARALAEAISATTALSLYDVLASGTIERLFDDLHATVREVIGHTARAAHVEDIVIKSGIIGEISAAAAAGEHQRITNLLFEKDAFPVLRSVDPNFVLVSRLISKYVPSTRSRLNHDVDRLSALEEERPVDLGVDPIVAAVERFVHRREEQLRRKNRRKKADNIEGIDNQLLWIEKRLNDESTEAAESGLIRLIDYGHKNTEREHIIKSLTRVANCARKAKHLEFAERVFNAIRFLGNEDSAAYSARAELLRDLGSFDDALVVLDQAIRLFPQEVVPRNAKAEALRDLGHAEDALAVLDETIRSFPEAIVPRAARAEVLRDLGRPVDALRALDDTIQLLPGEVVPPSARAEVLRDLGRLADALVAFDQTIKMFPRDVVPRTGRAVLLRDLGRHQDALAALDETISLFQGDAVPRTVRAEVLRDLGRHQDALAAFDEIIRLFPRDVVPRTARAEVLRDLGRSDEAIIALEELSRFSPDQFVKNARASLLSSMRRHGDVVECLGPRARTPKTRQEWIGFHILAVSNLRTTHVDEALAMLTRGRNESPFRDTWSYFDSALAIALLTKRKADEATEVIDRADRIAVTAEQRKTVYLLRTHAIVESGKLQTASEFLRRSAAIITFENFLQKRLAQELDNRIQIIGSPLRTMDDTVLQRNEADIFELETRLVTRLTRAPTRFHIAA